jgi:hypothetical protein
LAGDRTLLSVGACRLVADARRVALCRTSIASFALLQPNEHRGSVGQWAQAHRVIVTNALIAKTYRGTTAGWKRPPKGMTARDLMSCAARYCPPSGACSIERPMPHARERETASAPRFSLCSVATTGAGRSSRQSYSEGEPWSFSKGRSVDLVERDWLAPAKRICADTTPRSAQASNGCRNSEPSATTGPSITCANSGATAVQPSA